MRKITSELESDTRKREAVLQKLLQEKEKLKKSAKFVFIPHLICEVRIRYVIYSEAFHI